MWPGEEDMGAWSHSWKAAQRTYENPERTQGQISWILESSSKIKQERQNQEIQREQVWSYGYAAAWDPIKVVSRHHPLRFSQEGRSGDIRTPERGRWLPPCGILRGYIFLGTSTKQSSRKQHGIVESSLLLSLRIPGASTGSLAEGFSISGTRKGVSGLGRLRRVWILSLEPRMALDLSTVELRGPASGRWPRSFLLRQKAGKDTDQCEDIRLGDRMEKQTCL